MPRRPMRNFKMCFRMRDSGKHLEMQNTLRNAKKDFETKCVHLERCLHSLMGRGTLDGFCISDERWRKTWEPWNPPARPGMPGTLT